MSAADDFLVEIGTEELPPKALRSLMTAFGQGLEAAVDEARLEHGAVHAYASPRRLAVLIEDLARRQADRTTRKRARPFRSPFDDDGNVTPAAQPLRKNAALPSPTLVAQDRQRASGCPAISWSTARSLPS